MLVNETRRLRRGDVVRVRFDPVEGSEQAGERPALIISPEILNCGATISVAAISSKKVDEIYPWECLLETGDGGLAIRSKVMFRHIRGISKSRVTGFYGSIEVETLIKTDEALKLAVGLLKI